MEERLKGLMQDLGNAIKDTLSDSENISEVVGKIKSAGYDIFLVLEATIGFNKIKDVEETGQGEQPESSVLIDGKINLTTSDSRFLKALKIAVDQDE